jgi:hypothetical protein
METINRGRSEMDGVEAEGVLTGDSQDDKQRQVRAPRKAIWELIIMVITLGFYLPFWAVSRARDMKAATDKSYRPWLWFFTPWFWIAGVIAYSTMFKDLQLMESSQQRDKWKLGAGLWIFAFMLLSLFFNFESKMQVPILAYLATMIAFCLLFALLHRRFNQWKLQDIRLTFKGKTSGYTWYEWLMVTAFLPLFLFLIYQYGWQALRTINEPKYDNQHAVVDQSLGFSFSIEGDGWTKVTPKQANFEMVGPGDDTSVFIYGYADDQSIDDITASRYEIVEDAYEKPKCSETKSFERGREGVRSMMSCKATFWGNDVILTSVVSEIDDTLIEFVGVASGTSPSFTKKVAAQITAMAKSFHILPRSGDE